MRGVNTTPLATSGSSVESGNPAHSLADSQRMREALGSLEHLVVIDVAMTETARLAHYVLPVPSQFEKWEATFFNFDFPRNAFGDLESLPHRDGMDGAYAARLVRIASS